MNAIPREKIKNAIIFWARHCGKQANNAITIAFLAPYFAEEPTRGLCPTMYRTGSYEGDMEQHEKLKRLVILE